MAFSSRTLYQLLSKELFHRASQANSLRTLSYLQSHPTIFLTNPSLSSLQPFTTISDSANHPSLTTREAAGVSPNRNISASRAYRVETWRSAAANSDLHTTGSANSGPQQDPKTLPSVDAASDKPSGKGSGQPEQEPKTIPSVSTAEPNVSGENRRARKPAQKAAPGVAEAKKVIKENAKKEHARSDREEILEAALVHVVTLGWSEAALAAGSRDIGLSQAAAGVFSRGGVELLEYFVDQCNNKLAKEVEEEGTAFSALSTKDKLVQAIRLRLEMQAPYVTTWPQALALQARPQNMLTAVKQRARLVDVLWEVTGDTSVDSSWYAKRGLVAAVYGSTELYMLTDFSPGFAETWKFLERRIEEAVELKKSADEFKHLAEAVGAGLGSTFGSTLDRLMRGGSSRKRQF